jgi:hypothetical protein
MWLIIMALAIGAVYASLLYLFSKKYSKGLTVLLFALRTIVVAIVFMLFINPYIKQKINKIEKPIIVFAQDNSESMVEYPQSIDSVKNALEKHYDVDYYGFGDQYTNISEALNTIARQYYKRNVGAVVLLSDGIVNQGVNPELTIESYPFPIYSITLGDTVAYPSMSIKDVKYNKTVQANMLFPLRVTANALNYKGEDMNVVVKMDGIEVENVNVPVTSNRFSKTFDFNIDSGEEGTKQIDIIVGDKTRRVFIAVTDKKYRVLCLARAPHPDIAAIKSALDDHFEFETRFDNIDDIDDYDLVIYHNVVRTHSGASLQIIGTDTDFDAFNKSQDVVTIKRGAANTNLDVKARYNNGFGLFTINSGIKNEIQSYPPLALPHSEITFSSRHDVLFNMNVMTVETPLPLLAFANDNEGNRQAFLFGTGCWCWKLYEYYHHKNNEGFNEVFSKTVKYLLTEKDKELIVNHKDSYFSTENITLTAELRNPSRELINDPDLQITISSAKETYEYVFSKGENNYHLNVGMLPEGIYKYHAHTTFGGVDYSASGTFTVESIGIEKQDLTADIERMRSLASQTGGKHYYITDIQQLTNDLQNDERITSISRQETRYDDLINLKWLFISILTLITIEWVLRKMFGVY